MIIKYVNSFFVQWLPQHHFVDEEKEQAKHILSRSRDCSICPLGHTLAWSVAISKTFHHS